MGADAEDHEPIPLDVKASWLWDKLHVVYQSVEASFEALQEREFRGQYTRLLVSILPLTIAFNDELLR